MPSALPSAPPRPAILRRAVRSAVLDACAAIRQGRLRLTTPTARCITSGAAAHASGTARWTGSCANSKPGAARNIRAHYDAGMHASAALHAGAPSTGAPRSACRIRFSGGWWTECARARGLAALALLGLGGGFAAVCAAQPWPWMMATGLVVLFTAYSLAMSLLHALSGKIAASREADPHPTLAAWGDSGALVGVLAASVLPALRPLIAAGGGWLMSLALPSALPVAVTATLFLFFVEDHLRLGPLAGACLAVFFLAAARVPVLGHARLPCLLKPLAPGLLLAPPRKVF